MRSNCFFLYFLLLLCIFANAANATTAQENIDTHTGVITTLAFSPDGKTLASGGLDRKIILWDIATNKALKTFLGHNSYIYAVTFSPDGKFLISGSGDRTIKFWDVQTGKKVQTLTGHEASVTALAISPDGKALASGDTFGTIKLWDIKTFKELSSTDGEGMINSIVFSPDSKVFADARSDMFIKVWDAKTGKQIRQFFENSCRFVSVAINPNSKTIAGSCEIFSYLSERSGTLLTLWDLSDGQRVRTLQSNGGASLSLAFGKDNHSIFTINTGYAVMVDISKGSTSKLFSQSESIAFFTLSPDGKYMASGSIFSGAKSILLWDTTKNRELETLNGNFVVPQKSSSQDGSGTGAGPGKDAGLGSGVGPGKGPGAGPGRGGPAGNPNQPTDYNKIFQPREVTQKAQITSKPPPAYTEKARYYMVQGTLRISLILAADGSIKNVRVVSELPFGLTDMAVQAAKGIKFKPATKDEKAVSQYITVEYNFRIY